MKTTVDITPHPKILRVLGEIEFQPWQCIAELIDNSIDGFLAAKREGTSIARPIVRVLFGRDSVVVKDNGLGMTLETLEYAVKVGWSSQEEFGSLGLYGVGFNIATARLGSKTTIWTTKSGDDAWFGLVIDLKELAKSKNYLLEVKTRTKSHSSMSGTEIEISGLRADWVDVLNNKTWLRTNVTDRLARIYGTMLRIQSPKPIGFSLHVNEQPVTAWEHCVWPADLEVYRKNEGRIRPIQEIDITYGTKYLQLSTGELFDSIDGLDPADVRPIPQRVYGWLGVQRYVDEKDYGVDILRNGRKIEVACKDLFYWGDVLEYPIDEQRNRRGRLVGEVHLDHGYVHYTKHRFERDHYSWQQLVKAVKHGEPLTNRYERKFAGNNTSPLGVLFRAFRRNSPQPGMTWRSILFIKDNDKARKWADQWRKGVLEYHNEQQWVAELDFSDQAPPPPQTPDETKRNPDEPSTPPPGNFILETTQQTEHPAPPLPSEERTSLPQLNLHVTGIGSAGTAYDLEVYAVRHGAPQRAKLAWIGKPTARGVYEFDVDVHHPLFNSATFRVEDAALSEFAHFIANEENAKVPGRIENSYSSVLGALRALHFGGGSLDIAQIYTDITKLRGRLGALCSAKVSDEDLGVALETLSSEERQRIELAAATSGEERGLAESLQLQDFAELISAKPEVFFRAEVFRKPWTPKRLVGKESLLDIYRSRLAREAGTPLMVLTQFAVAPPDQPTRAQLTFVRAALTTFTELLSI